MQSSQVIGPQKIHFTLDPSKRESIVHIIDMLGGREETFRGENDRGEVVLAAVGKESVVCRTFQENGWTRVNTYWRSGVMEETYEQKGEDKDP